jgi:AraC-like DNA-binding protein
VRRLMSESLTFSHALHDVRCDLAVQYLPTMAYLASRLQEVSACTNAFRRWVGKTPREARFQPRHP